VALFLVVFLVHPQPAMLADGTTAPPIVLQDTAGHTHTVVGAATRGPVLVEFMSTTCPTCISDAATLCAAAARSSSALVFGIDASAESGTALDAFAAQHLKPPCPITLLLDPGMRVSESYVVSVVPTVYVVDTHDNIAFAGFGGAGITQGIASLEQLAGA
jgi:peroxiredoxin